MLGYDIAIAMVAIMISVGGMILGIGYALDDKKVKEFGRNELYNSFINAVIVGSLITAFSANGLVTSVINGLASGVSGYSCPSQMEYSSALCFAYNYAVGVGYVSVNGASYPTLIDSVLEVMVPLSLLYSGLSLLSSIKLDFVVVSFGLNGAFTPVLTPIRYAIDVLSATLIGVETQGVLLQFISMTAIPILLPVGIVLRTFYFTRRLGGTIMAIAIGLFAVFPMTYVLDANLASAYSNSFGSSNINALITSAQNTQSSILGQLSAYKGALGAAIGLVNYVTGLVNALISNFAQFLQSLEDYVAMLIVEAVFLPVFSVILTVISIRELARVLGSEVNFGRLYLV